MRKLMGLLGLGVLALGVGGVRAEETKVVKSAPAKASVVIRLASDSAVAGWEEMSFNNVLLFLAPNAVLGGPDVAATRYAKTDAGEVFEMTLTPAGATSAASVIKQNAGARLGVLVDGKVIAAPVIDGAMLKGTALTVSTAALTPRGPAINVVAAQPTVAADGLVSVDVFLSQANDLRGYQVALEAVGGRAGALQLVDIHQETARPDFIFGAQQIVNAVDVNGGRAVAALFTGTVDLTSPAYLATFTYKASSDAAGQFKIKVRVSDETALRDSNTNPIAYQAGQTATINIAGK